MTQHGITLIGGGGHAKVVLDAMREAELLALGFVDDSSSCALSGVLERLGSLDSLDDDARVIVTIGDVGTRRRVLDALGSVRVAGPVIHDSSIVSPSASIGEGAFVGPGAIINADARIGAHAIINSGAIIEHDCRVGENTHIAPGSVLGGGAVVGDDTLVGIGSRVLPGVTLGARVVLGGGAVAIGDVPDDSTAAGVPARVASTTIS